jgi:CubicO group peptidase (beta-lactamase class C family)
MAVGWMMRRAGALLLLAAGCAPPPPVVEKAPDRFVNLPTPPELLALDTRVPEILEMDRIPGAVILVGQGELVLYRKAFGNARLDTVWDLASCTKVVGTTTAAMKLVEEGRLGLEDPVSKHVPAFAGRDVTIRELLVHQSGLPAYLTPKAKTPDGILGEISGLRMEKSYRYSCLNMVSLARVIEQVTGKPLATYLQEAVFGPLGMKDTGWFPDPARCALTAGDVPAGTVHDPLARTYANREHQSGNAGLFSTADDLAVFCRQLLRGRILKPGTVDLMLTPAPSASKDARALGWDLFDDTPFRPGIGHTGFTGTLIWMDPSRSRYCLVLSNRTFHGEKTDVRRLRREVLSRVNP